LNNIPRPRQLRAPLSRRDLIHLASASGLLAFPGSLLFGASDFWNKKQAADWSVAEVEQLKTKSPWAKKVRGEMSTSGPMAGSGGGGGRGGRGAGSLGTADDSVSNIGGGSTDAGGGRGGRGGDTAGPPRAEGPEVVIRWENAKPLLDATKLTLTPALDNHYAISITGLPPEMIAAFGRGGGGRGRRGREGQTPQPEASEDPAARQKAMVDRIKAAASLSVKGKDPAVADLLMQTMDKQTMIFGFPKDALSLVAADKEVVFTLKLTAIFKVKFELKEMMYGGQLAV